MTVSLADRLASATAALGPLAQVQRPLADLCTYRVGGPAALFVEANSVATLETVRDVVAEFDLPVLSVGRGSNLLVADSGFDGLVVRLGNDFAGIEVPSADEVAAARTDGGSVRVVAGGAALLPVVARRTVAAGLAGFAWAVGVPGSVGGAVRMNAGGHGADMADSLGEVSVFDLRHGGPEPWSAEALRLGYRHSALEPHHLVLAAAIDLEPGDPESLATELSDIVAWRRANQPGGSNAGSVFANPDGDSAGRLIDAAGLKGFRIGTAEVSTKHANFIQADPDGSADDVAAVMAHVRAVIAERHGIELRIENHLRPATDPDEWTRP